MEAKLAEKYVTNETFGTEIGDINSSISKNNEEIQAINSNIGTINEETRSINEDITGIENTIDELKTGTIKPVLYPKRNIVVFGDSWTTVQNGAFINALKAEYDVENVEWAEKDSINKNNPNIEIDFNTSVSPNTLPVQLQSDVVTISVGGSADGLVGGLYIGYFSDNTFKSNGMNAKWAPYRFSEITLDTYTHAAYHLL